MNLANMLTRRDPLKTAFVTLEDGMADVLKEELLLAEDMPAQPQDNPPAEAADDNLAEAGDEQATTWQPEADPAERITAHTQSRVATHAAFDDARTRAQQDLNRIAEALAGIVASHNMGRQFLDDSYADILRANDLEIANAAHVAETRRLSERVDKLERLRVRYDQLVEVLKRREAKLLDEAETMRDTIGALRLELVEARSATTRSESLAGELQAAHAARGGEAERYLRQAEMLREKTVALSVELDLAQRKQTESRRRAEELSSMHAHDSARLAEIMARLVNEESETGRLQKLTDALETKLIEANENATRLADDLAERDRRHQSEGQAARDEIQALNTRLQAAAGEQHETAASHAEMRARLDDLEAERQVSESRLASLTAELAGKRAQSVDAGPGEPADAANAEAERMRGEIDDLRATVARLEQYESLYTAAKKSKGKAVVASGFSVEGGKIVPDFETAKPDTQAEADAPA